MRKEIESAIKAKNKKIICLMRFGSHLYGTDTEDSDEDYKGIYMPNQREICLGKIPKSFPCNTKTGKIDGEKNSKEDIDCEVYSLHYFIELACKGETAALDMLHCNKENLLMTSQTWWGIVSNRKSFYTKNLKSFVGYARKQAAKYGLKGSRLNVANDFLDLISEDIDDTKRLIYYWEELPQTEHSRFIDNDPNDVPQYQICGKILSARMRTGYAYDIMKKFVDDYGERARQAANNEGIDWKAVSHAIRAALQVKEILEYGTITFPLKDADILKLVKAGKMDFLVSVLPWLEYLMKEVEILSKESQLPEKVDREQWNEFIEKEVMQSITLNGSAKVHIQP